MNQIYDMLSGMDIRGGTKSMSKDTAESGRNNRFDELLKEQAEKGEAENAKTKKLLEQILAGQAGTVICPQAFWTLNETLQIPSSVTENPGLAQNFVYEGIQSFGNGAEPEGRGSLITPWTAGAVQKEVPVRLPRMPGEEAVGVAGKGEKGISFDPKQVVDMKQQEGESAWNKTPKFAPNIESENSFRERETTQILHPGGFPIGDVEHFQQDGVKDVIENQILHENPDMNKLSDSILKNITKGAREFEIWLHPRNLGSLLVKASYEEGQTMISLVSGETKAIQAVLQNAGDLADMLKTRLGGALEVVIDVPNFDYLQQQRDDQKSQEHDRQQPQKEVLKDMGEEDGEDFLHQLRLGLM